MKKISKEYAKYVSIDTHSVREEIDFVKKTLAKEGTLSITVCGEKIDASKEDVSAIQFMVAMGYLSPSNITGLAVREDGTLKQPSGLDDINDIVAMKLLEIKCGIIK